MLKEIASLGGVAAEILADLEALSAPKVTTSSDEQKEPIAETGATRREPVITPVRILPSTPEPDVEKTPYQEILAAALMYQAASDSLKDLATAARTRIRESEDPNERWVWQKQIMVWDKKARDQEEIADELYTMLDQERGATAPAPVVNLPDAIMVDTVMEELTVYRYRDQEPDLEGEPGNQPAMPQPSAQPASGYINRFDVLAESPYSASNPIPVDVTLPVGVFYRIQLGAFGQPVEPGAFMGISPITAETIPDRGLIKYYAGKFNRYADAVEALARIRSRGYEDSFIVAWYQGRPVSTQKAKQLE